jgi:hypothetical protein
MDCGGFVGDVRRLDGIPLERCDLNKPPCKRCDRLEPPAFDRMYCKTFGCNRVESCVKMQVIFISAHLTLIS